MKTAQRAALLMALFVILGAFGAHSLKQRISPEMLTIYQTGIFYHAIHAAALFAIAWLEEKTQGSLISAAGWFIIAGIVLFSGSLYALALTGVKALGIITPFGGLSFIIGWIMVAVALSQRSKINL